MTTTIPQLFETYPLTLPEVTALIKEATTTNDLLVPLINQVVSDYLLTDNADYEEVWDAFYKLEGSLDEYISVITVLLTNGNMGEVTKEGAYINIINNGRLTPENLQLLSLSVNEAKESALNIIRAAIDKALLFIEIYYKREIQEAMPLYRYQSMIDDLKAASIAADSID